MNKKITLKLIIFPIFLISLLLGYLYYFQFLPQHEKQLKRGLYDQTKAVAAVAKSAIVNALSKQDDIQLIAQIETIKKINGVTTVYILNNEGKVVTHDKTNQWGKTYNDSVLQKAIAGKKTGMRPFHASGGYIFYMPLTSSETLFIGLTTNTINQKIGLLKENAVYSIAVSITICALFFIVFVFSQVTSRFNKFEGILKSVALGGGEKIRVKQKDEFSTLSELLNSIIEKSGSQGAVSPGNTLKMQASFSSILNELSNGVSGGLVVTDYENRIIHANKEAIEFFSITGDVTGRHILDVISDADFIDILKKAVSSANTAVEVKLQGKTVSVVSVGSNHGTVIRII